MARNVFVSYSHRLDQDAAEEFRKLFSDQREVFVDKSMRHDIGDNEVESIKARLRDQIRQCSVTVVLIGPETDGRWWVDWEIYNSLRKNEGNDRSGLLGIRIKHKQQSVPQRLLDNVATMGHIIDWPRDYRTLSNEIDAAFEKRFNPPDLRRPVRERNSDGSK